MLKIFFFVKITDIKKQTINRIFTKTIFFSITMCLKKLNGKIMLIVLQKYSSRQVLRFE